MVPVLVLNGGGENPDDDASRPAVRILGAVALVAGSGDFGLACSDDEFRVGSSRSSASGATVPVATDSDILDRSDLLFLRCAARASRCRPLRPSLPGRASGPPAPAVRHNQRS